jgi:glycosyltransferase involved in cell wall biosynthesis
MVWKLKIQSVINESFCSIYIHDLPLVKVGLYFKNKYHIKLIADQHEYFAEYISKASHMTSFLGKIIYKISKWENYEIKYLNQSDLLISVLKPLCTLYQKKLSLNSSSIITLPNTPLKKMYLEFEKDIQVLNKYMKDKKYRVIFISSFLGKERQLNLMIDAIPYIVKKIPNFKFMILGQLHYSYDLISHIKANRVEHYVEVLGKVPINLLPSYLCCSSIGLNIHDLKMGKEIHETVFTKFFQYVALNNAVITTRMRYMSSLVEKYKIGYVVEENPKDIASAIIEMMTKPNLLEYYIDNTKKVKDIFWEETSLNWQKAIINLLR